MARCGTSRSTTRGSEIVAMRRPAGALASGRRINVCVGRPCLWQAPGRLARSGEGNGGDWTRSGGSEAAKDAMRSPR